jgi:hypothetical protein
MLTMSVTLPPSSTMSSSSSTLPPSLSSSLVLRSTMSTPVSRRSSISGPTHLTLPHPITTTTLATITTSTSNNGVIRLPPHSLRRQLRQSLSESASPSVFTSILTPIRSRFRSLSFDDLASALRAAPAAIRAAPSVAGAALTSLSSPLSNNNRVLASSSLASRSEMRSSHTRTSLQSLAEHNKFDGSTLHEEDHDDDDGEDEGEPDEMAAIAQLRQRGRRLSSVLADAASPRHPLSSPIITPRSPPQLQRPSSTPSTLSTTTTTTAPSSSSDQSLEESTDDSSTTFPSTIEPARVRYAFTAVRPRLSSEQRVRMQREYDELSAKRSRLLAALSPPSRTSRLWSLPFIRNSTFTLTTLCTLYCCWHILIRVLQREVRLLLLAAAMLLDNNATLVATEPAGTFAFIGVWLQSAAQWMSDSAREISVIFDPRAFRFDDPSDDGIWDSLRTIWFGPTQPLPLLFHEMLLIS